LPEPREQTLKDNERTPAQTLLKWLTPGIGVKRWLAVLFCGVTSLGLGFGILLLHFFRTYPVPPVESILTLGGSPLWLRAALAGVIGAALVVLAMYRVSKAILSPWVGRDRLIDTLVEQRHLQRGPKIVAIGGGTGLPALLRGLKEFTSNLTAIVTVADDGGSSGRLRRDLGVLPPGDFRNNIAALARNENLMTQLFQYRFGEGGLEGHSFGNLFITALSSVTGSFEQALIESSRVLAIRGQVLPSTLEDVTLMADLRDEPTSQMRRVEGESAIPEVEGVIERVFLEPENAPAYPDAVRAILAADIIVIGPGSLFTSILPNLLVPGIVEAIRRARALRVYVCNVATQSGETNGFSVVDHVRAIERQVGPGLFDVVLVNDYYPALDADANFAYVQLGTSNGSSGLGARIVACPLVDRQYPWRHDSRLLAQAVINLVEASEDAAA
jgi:uncharacterized cofD-like protein